MNSNTYEMLGNCFTDVAGCPHTQWDRSFFSGLPLVKSHQNIYKLDFMDIPAMNDLVRTGVIFFFSIGFGPIPWLMVGELFSPEVKERASSISSEYQETMTGGRHYLRLV